jgi:hypothetical protein
MDLIRDYALQIPTTIIAEMLGVLGKDRLKFHRWSNAAIASTSSRWGVLMALPHAVAFLRYIRMLVKARRAKPEDDLVTALVRALRVVGYFERPRRNSQKKPTKNIAAVKNQSNGFARKPEFQPIGPVSTWYTTDR